MTLKEENNTEETLQELAQDSSKTIIRRIYSLTLILAIGFSVIWVLPKSESMKLSCLSRHLPMQFDTMIGKRVEVTNFS